MKLFLLGLILMSSLPEKRAVKSRTLLWNDFRVRYGTDFAKAYIRFPKTEAEAIISNFYPLGPPVCSTQYCFQGKRYMHHIYQNAIILLFDIKGYIAGVQNRIPATAGSSYPPQKLIPPFIKENDYYVLTVYFIHPSRICTQGRTAADFYREGTGDAFYFQNGPNPFRDLEYIPKVESQFNNPRWNKIGCLPLMGYHYGGFEIKKDLDCDTMWPLLPIYEKGVLISLDFAFLPVFESPIYEHDIPAKDYAGLIGPKPQCLLDMGDVNITTLHIYMIDDPYYIDCDK